MPYVPTRGSGDAVAEQSVNNLKVMYDWAVANGQTGKLMVSEIGIPGSSAPGTDPIPGSGTGATYDPLWEPTLQQVYEHFNLWNFHVTAWNASEWNVDLRAYRTADGNTGALTYRTTVSSVLENNLGNGTYLRGVNYAGGEFSDYGPNGALNRSHTEEPNAGYYYPNPSSFATLYSRGMVLIRIPVRWERVQPTLKGNLDSAEMAKLAASVNAAGAAGCKILLDIHNYGRYDTATTNTTGSTSGVYMFGQNAPSGIGGTMIDCFADLWTKLATYFKNNSAIWGYDICNEPHDLPGGVSDWQSASRAAVEAIRLVDQTVKIAVEGYSYSTVANWASTNGSPWLTETIPAGQNNAGQARNTDPNIVWNGHLYLDPRTNGLDGGYQDTYANELSYATSQGYSSYTNSGYVLPATNNTLQTGTRTLYTADYSSQTAAGGSYNPPSNYNGVTVASGNTVTFGQVRSGSTDNAMKVVSSSTSNEASLRRSLTGSVARTDTFVFEIDPASTVSASLDSAIKHYWRDDNATDLYEVSIKGSGSGYKVGLKMTVSPYTATYASSPTVLAYGTRYQIKFEVTNSALNVYVAPLNSSFGSAEASVSGTYSGINIGGMATGKFYGTDPYTSYYYTDLAGITASYYAPPNGGLMATNTPPSVSLSASQTSGTAPLSITLTASASDADGTVSSVVFKQDGVAIATDTTSPYSAVVTALPAGTYAYTAVATDNSGASSTSNTVTVTVSAASGNTPPTVSLSLSASSGTAPASVTATATASDTDGTVSKVDFYQNGVLVATRSTSPYTYAASGLPAGSYVFLAVATDNSGGTASDSKTFTVTGSGGSLQYPPAVTLSVSSSQTVPSTVSLVATATGTAATITSVSFYRGSLLIAADTTSPYGATDNNVPAGSYTYTAVAVDSNGNSTTSYPVVLTILSVPQPAVTTPTETYAKDPSSKTFAEIVANAMSIANVKGQSQLVPQFKEWVNDGLREMTRGKRYRFFEADYNLETVAGQEFYDFPSYVYDVFSVKGQNGQVLGAMPGYAYDRIYPYSSSSDCPVWYRFTGASQYSASPYQKVGIYPVPSSAGTKITFRGWRRIPRLSGDTDIPFLPPEYADALEHYAAHMFFASDGDARAQSQWQLYKNLELDFEKTYGSQSSDEVTVMGGNAGYPSWTSYADSFPFYVPYNGNQNP